MYKGDEIRLSTTTKTEIQKGTDNDKVGILIENEEDQLIISKKNKSTTITLFPLDLYESIEKIIQEFNEKQYKTY